VDPLTSPTKTPFGGGAERSGPLRPGALAAALGSTSVLLAASVLGLVLALALTALGIAAWAARRTVWAGALDWLGRPVCGAFGKRPRLVVEPGVERVATRYV